MTGGTNENTSLLVGVEPVDMTDSVMLTIYQSSTYILALFPEGDLPHENTTPSKKKVNIGTNNLNF